MSLAACALTARMASGCQQKRRHAFHFVSAALAHPWLPQGSSDCPDRSRTTNKGIYLIFGFLVVHDGSPLHLSLQIRKNAGLPCTQEVRSPARSMSDRCFNRQFPKPESQLGSSLLTRNLVRSFQERFLCRDGNPVYPARQAQAPTPPG
eukprot:1069982-Rhodomonas_salina.2